MEVIVQGPGDMIRAAGTMNDALAQLCHMRRSMQQLEVLKVTLERGLHESETNNRKLMKEVALTKEELRAQREVASQEIAKLRKEGQSQRAASPVPQLQQPAAFDNENAQLKEIISQLQQQLEANNKISPRRQSRVPSPRPTDNDTRRVEELEKENRHLLDRIKNLEFLCDGQPVSDEVVKENSRLKDRVKHLEVICDDREINGNSQSLLERLWASVQILLDVDDCATVILPTWIDIDRACHVLSSVKQVCYYSLLFTL